MEQNLFYVSEFRQKTTVGDFILRCEGC